MDIVQEALYECYRGIKKLRKPEIFEAWFNKLLIRVCWRMASKERKSACASIDEAFDENMSTNIAAGIYKKTDGSDKAKCILYMTNSKSEEYKEIKAMSKSEGNKNLKEFSINNITVQYYESPILKGLEEIEKGGKVPQNFYNEQHEILTAHTINWEHNGIGYSMMDNGNNVSLDDMKAVAEEIVH